MGFDFGPIAVKRREYGDRALDESALSDSPFVVFDAWLTEAMKSENEISDPTAMVLSTVDSEAQPNARVVLLKALENEKFVFYTNYDSAKAHELDANPKAALTFFWPTLVRQVRIRGKVTRVSRAQSEAYFATRSLMSQCSAVVSHQSQVIDSREVLVEAAKTLYETQQSNQASSIPCPEYWGGFSLAPVAIEFWQGRDHRLHDRVLYSKNKSNWTKKRLAS